MPPSQPSLRRITRRFAALGDATRLRVLDLLAERERCVCELQDALRIPQSLLSFHLRKLKEAGLVVDRRDGRWIYYAASPEALSEAARFLRAVRAPGRRACC